MFEKTQEQLLRGEENPSTYHDAEVPMAQYLKDTGDKLVRFYGNILAEGACALDR